MQYGTFQSNIINWKFSSDMMGHSFNVSRTCASGRITVRQQYSSMRVSQENSIKMSCANSYFVTSLALPL